MEFYKSLPSLWRGKIKYCCNKHLKILPIKTLGKLTKLTQVQKIQ